MCSLTEGDLHPIDFGSNEAMQDAMAQEQSRLTIPVGEPPLNEVAHVATIFFPVEGSDLDGGDASVLAQVVRAYSPVMMAGGDGSLLAFGSTDGPGEEVDNLALSEARAQTVVQATQAAFRFPPSAASEGLGEEPTKGHEALARRVDLMAEFTTYDQGKKKLIEDAKRDFRWMTEEARAVLVDKGTPLAQRTVRMIDVLLGGSPDDAYLDMGTVHRYIFKEMSKDGIQPGDVATSMTDQAVRKLSACDGDVVEYAGELEGLFDSLWKGWQHCENKLALQGEEWPSARVLHGWMRERATRSNTPQSIIRDSLFKWPDRSDEGDAAP
jgi:outer membrane protein OmpA-like peptidoglycan-associated protein